MDKLTTAGYLSRTSNQLNWKNRKIKRSILKRRAARKRHARALGRAASPSAIIENDIPEWLMMHAANAIIAGDSISPALEQCFARQIVETASAMADQVNSNLYNNWKVQYRLCHVMPYCNVYRANTILKAFFSQEDAHLEMAAWMFVMLRDKDYWYKSRKASARINYSILLYKWMKFSTYKIKRWYERKNKIDRSIYLAFPPEITVYDQYKDVLWLKSNNYSLLDMSKISWSDGKNALDSYNRVLKKIDVRPIKGTKTCPSSQMTQKTLQSPVSLLARQQRTPFG